MKMILAFIICLFALVNLQAADWMAYVISDKGLLPVNLTTLDVGEAIPVNGIRLAITPDGKTIYVSCGDQGVIPVDLLTNTVGAPIKVGNSLGTSPQGIAITPDGRIAYVANNTNVIPINIATNLAGTPITLNNFSAASMIAITPNGLLAYVTKWSIGDSACVVPIDLTTSSAKSPIILSEDQQNYPYENIAITPDGKTAYVAHDGNVTPFDIATGIPGASITALVRYEMGIAITPDGKTAYLIGDDCAVPIDLATNSASTPIYGVGGTPTCIAITPDGKTAYVTNVVSGMLTAIDIATNTIIQTKAIAGSLGHIAIVSRKKIGWGWAVKNSKILKIK